MLLHIQSKLDLFIFLNESFSFMSTSTFDIDSIFRRSNRTPSPLDFFVFSVYTMHGFQCMWLFSPLKTYFLGAHLSGCKSDGVEDFFLFFRVFQVFLVSFWCFWVFFGVLCFTLVSQLPIAGLELYIGKVCTKRKRPKWQKTCLTLIAVQRVICQTGFLVM